MMGRANSVSRAFIIVKSLMQPNIEATKDHCKFCFETLEAKLKKQKLPEFPKGMVDHKVPIFVTWMLDGELRGCIGTFEHSNLSKVLSQYALISALEDDRFDPISMEQMPHLSVGVSFLVNFRKDLEAYDWEVGKHGIILELKRNGRQYSATFLPEVAQQQKWDKKTTLKHLMHKAGCNLPLEIVQKQIKITSYESSKAQFSYKQWKEMSKAKSK